MEKLSTSYLLDYVLNVEKELFSIISDKTDYQDLLNKAMANEVKILHGSDSDLGYGYLNPTPIFELVVGNVKRGRIIKRPKVPHSPFEYYFDKNNKILLVRRDFHMEEKFHTIDLFMFRGNDVISFHFQDPQNKFDVKKAMSVTRTRFGEHGLMIEYEEMQLLPYRLFHDNFGNSTREEAPFNTDLNIERYHYVNGKLGSIEMIWFNPNIDDINHNSNPRLNHIQLYKNEEDEITSYEIHNLRRNYTRTYKPSKPFRINKVFYEYWNQLMIGNPRID